MIDVIQESYNAGIMDDAPIGVRFTPTDILIPAGMQYENWYGLFQYTCKLQTASKWWIAKLINYGEHAYGEKYTQALSMTGMTLSTLQDWCYVERNVDPSVRTELLSFSHHKAVAKMSTVDQRKWLRRAIENDWDVAELRQAIKDYYAQPEDETECDDPISPNEPPAQIAEEPEPRPDWQELVKRFVHGNDIEYVTNPIHLATLGQMGAKLVYVDIDPDFQAEAASLLRTLIDKQLANEAIFLADLHPADEGLYPLWEKGISLISEFGTLFYLGPNDDRFISCYGEHGVVVRLARSTM